MHAQALLERSVALQQRVRDVVRRRDALQQQLAAAEALLEAAPQVQAVLDEAQRRVNDAVVGGLSDMLTYLLQGVMDDPERRIVCESEVDAKGQSQVRFFVQRSGGQQEDILDGNGGSVANIVCTGLRLISVCRAKRMRKLLVLDEPDCWLNPQRVRDFIGVLHKAVQSLDFDLQVLLITHHDIGELGADVNVIDLVRQKGQLSAQCHIVQPAQGDELAAIELQHWRAHHHTFIALGSGLNVIRGANNIGKSAVVEALRCAVYGGARADVVEHGHSAARVKLVLANGQSIILQRQRKGSPAALYQWLDARGQVLREESAARGAAAAAPAWIEQAIGIAEVDGQQLHIADQKQPIFLLDKPATQQTAVLSVGQEAYEIVQMLQRWRDAKRSAQQTLRTAQAELEVIRRALLDVDLDCAWVQQAQQLLTQQQALQQSVQRTEQARELLRRMQRCSAAAELDAPRPIAPPAWQDAQVAHEMVRRIKALQPLQKVQLPSAPTVAAWVDTQPMRACAQALRRLMGVRDLRAVQPIVLSEMQPSEQAKLLAQRIKLLRSIMSLRPVAAPTLRDAHDVDKAAKLAEAIRTLKAEVTHIKELAKSQQVLLEQAKAQIATLEEELGCCPLCGHVFEGALA